ncbi:MAG: ComF family protein [Patescibacteria group bacterium]
MNILNTILDIVFPVNCIFCKKRGEDFCIDCINSAKDAERESAKWIFPLYDYRHPPIKKALWFLKYNKKKKIASIFAKIMYHIILEELSDLSIMENFKNPILIPIPLTKKRQRERGYNQAELIAKKLIELDDNENFILKNDILIKNKETIHQANIKNRNIRLKNLIGSFIVKNKEEIKNRNIILIDDITTTGATLNEARKTLKKAGAKKIVAFTVAH